MCFVFVLLICTTKTTFLYWKFWQQWWTNKCEICQIHNCTQHISQWRERFGFTFCKEYWQLSVITSDWSKNFAGHYLSYSTGEIILLHKLALLYVCRKHDNVWRGCNYGGGILSWELFHYSLSFHSRHMTPPPQFSLVSRSVIWHLIGRG